MAWVQAVIWPEACSCIFKPSVPHRVTLSLSSSRWVVVFSGDLDRCVFPVFPGAPLSPTSLLSLKQSQISSAVSLLDFYCHSNCWSQPEYHLFSTPGKDGQLLLLYKVPPCSSCGVNDDTEMYVCTNAECCAQGLIFQCQDTSLCVSVETNLFQLHSSSCSSFSLHFSQQELKVKHINLRCEVNRLNVCVCAGCDPSYTKQLHPWQAVCAAGRRQRISCTDHTEEPGYASTHSHSLLMDSSESLTIGKSYNVKKNRREQSKHPQRFQSVCRYLNKLI